jgi:hypothetical protein
MTSETLYPRAKRGWLTGLVTALALLLVLPWPLLYFFGGPLLFWAIQRQDEKITRLLANINPNWLRLKNDKNECILDLVILAGMEDLAIFLAEKDKNYVTNFPRYYHPENQAKILKNVPNFLNWFLKQNRDVKNILGPCPISVAIALDSEELMEELLKRGESANENRMNRDTALGYAITENKINLIRILLRYGALPDEKELRRVIFRNQIDVIKLLIEKNVLNRIKLYNNSNCLHLACLSEKIEVVEILIKSGININEQDRYGLTPLCCVIGRIFYYYKSSNKTKDSTLSIAKILLENGADPNIPNKKGETALDLYQRDRFMLQFRSGRCQPN